MDGAETTAHLWAGTATAWTQLEPLLAGVRRHEPVARVLEEIGRTARHEDRAGLEVQVAELARVSIASGVPIDQWLEAARQVRGAVAVALKSSLPAEHAFPACMRANELLDLALVILARAYARHGEALAAVAETSRRIVEVAPDAVISVDADGAISAFNPAAERVLGHRAADVIGKPLADVVIPERHRADHLRGFARILAGGESRVAGRRLEMTALTAGGREIPVELAITATKTLDGRPAFTGFLRDLSEHHRAMESATMWSHTLEQAAFGIVVSESSSRVILRTNPAYARMLGYEPEELVGMVGDRLLTPATAARVSRWRTTLAQDRYTTFELTLSAKDGQEVPVLVSTSVVRSAGEDLLISTVLDNRERVRIELQRAEALDKVERNARQLAILSAAAHEFALATGSADDLLEIVARRLSQSVGESCVVRLIGDGPWLEPSHAFYHPDPLVRDALRGIIAVERVRFHEGVAGTVAATGQPIVLSNLSADDLDVHTPRAFRTIVADAGIRHVLAVALRSRGRTTGVVTLLRAQGARAFTDDELALVQDLADRAGLAIDNVSLLATLERRVLDRTADLEGANQELEAFSYSVSHDLRAPLRAIDGFSRALESDYGPQLDAEARRFLDRIRAGTQRMGRLIDDLLALSRITRRPLEPRTIDLGAIAAEVVAELRRRDPARSVEVTVAEGMTVRADPRMITILFENLIGNAWKFTGKTGSPRIEIGKDDAGYYVRDNGAGFDMSYASKLFLPFQRLHAATDFEGEGVGLATVHRIVSHHRGRIWAEGAVGAGAVFHFTLGDPT